MPDSDWKRLNRKIIKCEACPRLMDYGKKIALEKRRAFQNEIYWGKPVPNFGDPKAKLLLVGLAPAAHGGHRTGRMFTGDRSGEWLYSALYRAGFANLPTSAHSDDNLQLKNCAVTAAVHCAPPGNKPLPSEFANCSVYLDRLLSDLPIQLILALGGLAWNASLKAIDKQKWFLAEHKKVNFTHGAFLQLAQGKALLGSYHPSQQNTFTKRLTQPMFDEIFAKAKNYLTEAESI